MAGGGGGLARCADHLRRSSFHSDGPSCGNEALDGIEGKYGGADGACCRSACGLGVRPRPRTGALRACASVRPLDRRFGSSLSRRLAETYERLWRRHPPEFLTTKPPRRLPPWHFAARWLSGSQVSSPWRSFYTSSATYCCPSWLGWPYPLSSIPLPIGWNGFACCAG